MTRMPINTRSKAKAGEISQTSKPQASMASTSGTTRMSINTRRKTKAEETLQPSKPEASIASTSGTTRMLINTRSKTKAEEISQTSKPGTTKMPRNTRRKTKDEKSKLQANVAATSRTTKNNTQGNKHKLSLASTSKSTKLPKTAYKRKGKAHEASVTTGLTRQEHRRLRYPVPSESDGNEECEEENSKHKVCCPASVPLNILHLCLIICSCFVILAEAEDEHLSKKARLRTDEEELAEFKDQSPTRRESLEVVCWVIYRLYHLYSNQFSIASLLSSLSSGVHSATLLPGNKVIIGTSDFQKMVNGKFSIVDKSMLIAEFVDSCDHVTLVLRPRRFGKSTNLSMLRLFFERIANESENESQSRREIFDQMKIKKNRPDLFANEFSKYPVIFLTFKDVNGTTWDDMLIKVRDLIGEIYREHRYLASSLEEYEKIEFGRIIDKDPTYPSLNTALRMLSKYLNGYHRSKCVVLVDEYDVPVNEAYNRGYYETALRFFQTLFSSLLKVRRKIGVVLRRTGVQRGTSTIEPLLLKASSTFKESVWELFHNKPILVSIRDDIRYENLTSLDDNSLWTLLYYAGYLTLDNHGATIPNYEVYMQWVEWIMPALGNSITFNTLLNKLISGSISDFKDTFEHTVMDCLSYYDVGGENSGNNAESFYHAFVLGLLIHIRDYNYSIKSNGEAGTGRYNVCLVPMVTHLPLAILMEFKVTYGMETIEAAAQKGLNQIEEKRYEVGLPDYVKQLVEFGIGFKGKRVCVMGKKLNLKQGKFVGERVCSTC
ncbi:hypothetical protein BC936DRAFT_144901 [Jimgerdemannia flammicorona]|uniref:AAA-ATPase-like domain-containing protein n=1 Tax=Jimgerdemannia flammicorona TaxID=994334 RepID=A0A433DLZ9_9FUNG|nr:hypothetical protein BC936DRAFT_144901 [Jimgerdemannia flammicorona]